MQLRPVGRATMTVHQRSGGMMLRLRLLAAIVGPQIGAGDS
jgi:hypothetical protein